MSLFNNLGGGNQNPLAMLQQLKTNPAQVLSQAGYNIPAGITNPQQIVNHLLQSGQVNQGKITQAQQMAQMFRR